MKRVIVVLITAFLITIILSSKDASADIYDDAHKYYATYGSTQVARLNENDGYIYFCSSGKTATGSIKYKTVGYTITLYSEGEKDSVEVKLGGTYIKDVSVVNNNGYTYVLRRVKLSSLNLLFNGNNKITWNKIFRNKNTYGFDAIMTVVENGKQLCGAISESGNYRKISAKDNKYLYRDVNGIKNARKWANPNDLNNFFGKFINFEPTDNVNIINMNISDGDNIYYSDGSYYVRKNSCILLSVKSGMLDPDAANKYFHPNYNLINVSGWGNNQTFYMAQGKTGAKCSGGLLVKSGSESNPLKYTSVAENKCTGSSDSLSTFKSSLNLNFEVENDRGVTVIPEARIYYNSIYPSKNSDINNLCDSMTAPDKKINLISDGESPIIDAQNIISCFGNTAIPFNVYDKGSGIRDICVYNSDGTLLIHKNYGSKRICKVDSAYDYYLSVSNGQKIYITATDNVGNIAKSNYITFVVPTAHIISASVSGGHRGYNCNNITSYVYGGNSEIASLVIKSEDEDNPNGDRIILLCKDVVAKTMPSGLYDYRYSFDPMDILIPLRDGKYTFSIVSGGKYVSSKPFYFFIDKDTTPPSVKLNQHNGPYGWNKEHAEFELITWDNYSTVSDINVICNEQILQSEYDRPDSNDETKIFSKYILRNEGVNNIQAVVSDVAGNKKTVKTTIKVDSTPPDYELPESLKGMDIISNLWVNKDKLNGSLEITDKLSGFMSQDYCFNYYKYNNGNKILLNKNDEYELYFTDDKKAHLKLTDSYIKKLKSGSYIHMLEVQDVAENRREIKLYMNVDCDPPGVDCNTDNAWSPDDMKGNVHITDKHSGIDSVIVMCDGEEVDSIYGVDKKDYKMYVDVSEYRKDKNEVHIIVTDKVGNKTDYMPKISEPLSVKAYIIRYDNGGAPELLAGEKAVLKIMAYGNADRLAIIYPEGYEEYNRDMAIAPKTIYEYDQMYTIPLECDEGIYNVEVKAYRGFRSVSDKPEFTVAGKITEKIRTRLRVR